MDFMVLPGQFLNKYMKIRFMLLLSIVIGCSKAKNIVDIPKNFVAANSKQLTEQNMKLMYKKEPFSGYLILIDSLNSKDTLEKIGYWKGFQHGISRKWYSNRQVKEIRNYRNGQKHGLQQAFWQNGNKKFEFTAQNDAPEGEMQEWDIHGKLFHLGHYKNGQEEGTQKLWYDNGKIRANYVIIDGKRYGLLGTKNCKNVGDSLVPDSPTSAKLMPK